ncbi:MAG TPA: hypothetical protein VFE50_15970 [Cyclobacteriaceae bacterium]|nr:hypothetical protein [Cyclobacteriaceae bacterium]
MKKIIVLAMVCVVTAACSVGAKKDLITGLSVANVGFAYDDVTLVDDQNQPLTTKELAMGKSITVAMTGIRNYGLDNGRVFPVLDITVVDKADTVVLDLKDMLANDGQGYTPEEASSLSGTITAGAPMKPGETYFARVRLYDYVNLDSKLVANFEFVVK